MPATPRPRPAPRLPLVAAMLMSLAGCASLSSGPDADARSYQPNTGVPPQAAPLSPTGSAVGDAVTGTLTLVLLLYLTLAGTRRH